MNWIVMGERVSKYFKTHERIKGGVEMGAALGDFLNGCDNQDIEDMLEYLTQMEHKTIQQSYVGLVLKSIKAFAENKNVDGRNRIAVERATELANYMEDANISEKMPCI